MLRDAVIALLSVLFTGHSLRYAESSGMPLPFDELRANGAIDRERATDWWHYLWMGCGRSVAIQLHHLVPGSDEARDEPLFAIVRCIHLGDCAQFCVGAEHQRA